MQDRRILHLVGQAHLDPVWLWPWQEGCSEALTTVQSAVNCLEAEADLCFTRSSAAIYQWVETADPALFARVRALVQAGRWEIVGGWIEQPDCNLPATEAFVARASSGKPTSSAPSGSMSASATTSTPSATPPACPSCSTGRVSPTTLHDAAPILGDGPAAAVLVGVARRLAGADLGGCPRTTASRRRPTPRPSRRSCTGRSRTRFRPVRGTGSFSTAWATTAAGEHAGRSRSCAATRRIRRCRS